METKTYKFVRNPIWPVKSTLEIGESGITNKGKLTAWSDIGDYSYSVKLVNGAPTYLYSYKSAQGKKTIISMVVPVTGKKSKKQMFEEIYRHMDLGFRTKVIEPRARGMVEEIAQGKSLTEAKCNLSEKGIEIRKGLIKKEMVFVPWEDVVLKTDVAGGYAIASAKEKKDSMVLMYETNPGCRTLQRVVELMTNADLSRK